MSKKIIFFDTETNGLNGNTSSVLSISALKCVFNGTDVDTIKDRYNRFYFRRSREAPNAFAMECNGLTDDVIRDYRQGVEYPKYFREDMQSFKDFCAGAIRFVGHKIDFDAQFLDFELKRTFCTMEENKNIMKLKNCNGRIKNPKLAEAACFYRISVDEDKCHGSEYDTLLCYEIFKKMLARKRSRQRVLGFLEKR
ncbi:MAG: 3'-5' exonuclease [Prevotellaceae bacterium]|jgi:DNA polymerase-3 subunit epsilon|nr:3'-5' exonuclease [Prevotellaceae bacterium]